MEVILYLLATVVSLALTVMYFAMFFEAILSWFVPEDSPVRVVLSVITAPVVLPVRALLWRIPALQELPIDISFLVAFLLLGLLRGTLPAIGYPV